jgi:hypothetical protein
MEIPDALASMVADRLADAISPEAVAIQIARMRPMTSREAAKFLKVARAKLSSLPIPRNRINGTVTYQLGALDDYLKSTQFPR